MSSDDDADDGAAATSTSDESGHAQLDVEPDESGQPQLDDDGSGGAGEDDNDAFARALGEMDAQPSPKKKKVYPPYVPGQYRNHPVARLVNAGADTAAVSLAHGRPGAASECELGEAYAYAVACYTGTGENVPPWAVALVATLQFLMVVSVAYFAHQKLGAPQGNAGERAAAPKKSVADLRAELSMHATTDDDDGDAAAGAA